MLVTVRRRCQVFPGYHHVHTWEVLNPRTERPFRRGRVVFFCRGGSYASDA